MGCTLSDSWVITDSVSSLSFPLDSDVLHSSSDVIGEMLYRHNLIDSNSDESSDKLL